MFNYFKRFLMFFLFLFLLQPMHGMDNDISASNNDSFSAGCIMASRLFLPFVPPLLSYLASQYRHRAYLNALQAARENNFSGKTCDVLNNFLQHIDINTKDKFGMTPLHNMLEMLHANPEKFDVQLFSKLLKNGADVNAPTKDGVSPIWMAMWAETLARKKHKKTDIYEFALDLLIDSKANINEKSANKTPLVWAIGTGSGVGTNIELVKKLCAARADLTEISQSDHNAFSLMLMETQDKPLDTQISNVRALMTHTRFKNDGQLDEELKKRFMETLYVFKERGEIPIELQEKILTYLPEYPLQGANIPVSSPHFNTLNQLKNRVKELDKVRKDGEQEALSLLPALPADSKNPNFEKTKELRSLVVDNNRLEKDFEEFFGGVKSVSPNNVVAEMHKILLEQKSSKTLPKINQGLNPKRKPLPQIAEN